MGDFLLGGGPAAAAAGPPLGLDAGGAASPVGTFMRKLP